MLEANRGKARSRSLKSVFLTFFIFAILAFPKMSLSYSISSSKHSDVEKSFDIITRRQLIFRVGVGATMLTQFPCSAAKAIDFVPASPYFSGTYKDAVEIIYTQRIAVDNIASVVEEGNIAEAGFKAMQLAAQIRTAGKIILDAYQEKISSTSSGANNNNILLLRFLSCQKKLAILLDQCDDCQTSLQNAMKGKLGLSTAAQQLRLTKVVDETKSAYDDFLRDIQAYENALSK